MSDTPILVGTSEPADPSKSIRIGFDEITDALALLRKLRTFEQARGMWPTAWHELDELLDRIDGVTAA